MDKAIEIRRGQLSEVFNRVVDERLGRKMPALLTTASTEPKVLMAVSTTFLAVAASPISPSTRARRFDDFISADRLTWRDVATTL